MIIEEIFNNIFGDIAKDTGLGLGSTGNVEGTKERKLEKNLKKEVKKEVQKAGHDLKKAFSRGVARAKDKIKEKETASDDKKKIAKNLRKDKDVIINKLISKRFVPTDDEGRYPNADLKNFMDEYKGDTEVEIPSTAIADVKYDPKSGVCHVKYVGGNKWYRFVNMSPQQFKSFMNSSSKGRYVQRVMRLKNHDPNYPRTI